MKKEQREFLDTVIKELNELLKGEEVEIYEDSDGELVVDNTEDFRRKYYEGNSRKKVLSNNCGCGGSTFTYSESTGWTSSKRYTYISHWRTQLYAEWAYQGSVGFIISSLAGAISLGFAAVASLVWSWASANYFSESADVDEAVE